MSLFKKLGGLFGKGEDGTDSTPDVVGAEGAAAEVAVPPDPAAPEPAPPTVDAETLHECAATPGSVIRCRELLEKGEDPLKQDADGRSALHVAAVHGNLEILEELKEHVLSVDPYDIHRLSPLICAIRAEQDPAAQLLIKQGAKLTLNVAFALGDLHLINRLFSEDKDALKHCGAPDELMTDFVTAMRRECDKEITKKGAGDEASRKAIEDDVLERSVPIIERLVDMGCHTDAFDSADRPALFQALQFQSTVLAAVLLRHDANPDFETEDGETPLSVVPDNSPEMLSLLKEHGAEEGGVGQKEEEEEEAAEKIEQEDAEPGPPVPTIKTNHPSPSERDGRRK
jgi:ankyrin repeat protein